MLLRACFCSLVLTLLTAIGCSHDSPTSPTSTTTTTTATAADPTYTEDWSDTVPVGGARFYSFTVTTYGTVNVYFTSVSGQYVPATVTVGLGLGQPDGESCTLSSSITTQSGVGPQLTGVYNPGVYCVQVSDVGNLYSPANFSLYVAYP